MDCSEFRIYHTVNEGLYLWDGDSGLLVDALHEGHDVGCSDTPEVYVQMMRKKEKFFAEKNDLLFTHAHPDHYSKSLVDEFLSLNKEAAVYCPKLERSNVCPCRIGDGIFRMKIRGYEIDAFDTEHDGPQYAREPHQSYMIRTCGKSLWLSGDALNDTALAEKVRNTYGDERIDAAFVNIYQIARSEGIRFLDILKPEKIILYHLPYEKDDTNHYRKMSERRGARLNEKGYHIQVLRSDRFFYI